MKKAVPVIVVLLLLSTVHCAGSTEPIRVLVDETRIFDLEELLGDVVALFEAYGVTIVLSAEDLKESFENTSGDFGYGKAGKEIKKMASMTIRKTGAINYNTLKGYDVLIIASFDETYTPAEVDAILQFVENGGGLLFLARYGTLNNSVSEKFGVKFPSESVKIREKKGEEGVDQFYVTDITSHSITEGVEKILLDSGVPITSYGSGDVLARTDTDSWEDKSGGETGEKDENEKGGPFDVLLAVSVGRGRAVFFGGNDTFSNVVLEEQGHQNRDLLRNMVKWLGEPGGPYKQYKVINEQAQNALSNAKSLYGDNKFSEAKEEFDSALELFQKSKEMYPNDEADSGIAEAESFIPTCEIGAEADTIFGKAEELFGKREYENAITEYGKAQALYNQIECEEKTDVCSQKIEESTAKISLREEATALYSKGKDALTQAPSFLSTGGYEESKSLFEKARSTWEEYGDADKVTECQEKIDLCTEKIRGIKKNQYMIIGAVAAAACVVVLFMWRRKPKPKAAEAPSEPKEAPEASPTT